MIDDSAPHRVFKIDELTRLITSQLIHANQESAVNLACACRYLEEPVLSTLWEIQESLHNLLETLPGDNWDWGYPAQGESVFRIVGIPSLKAWSRVHRYASWMHKISDDWMVLEEETIFKFRFNTPDGGWFPALQGLSWCIRRSNLPYVDLFFSPNLKRISISMSWGDPEVPRHLLPAVASTISAIPAAALQYLSVYADHRGISPAYLKDSLSSVILRCGPSFTEFSSPIPLSDVAINHLIHLPNFHTWHTEHPPPNFPASFLPLVFAPLKKFILGEGAARGWLSFFKRFGNCVSSTQGTTPLSRVAESLESLHVGNFPNPIIGASFASIIQTFRNLTHLNVNVDCYDELRDQCVFKLNDDNVFELAMALPRLDSLLLGYPCHRNTCATTVACLLPISVHCTELQSLEIHLNTTSIVDDLENISEDPRFQGLRLLRKCSLSYLDVRDMPLTLDESGLETVTRGMMDIFPDLVCCEGWDELNWKIAERGGVY